MAAVLALLASLTWGTADFLGGTAARRLPPAAVVAVSQSWALLGMAVVAVATTAWDASTGYVGWALLAAGFGVVALTAFYSALSVGRMGVVAPIAALGVAVPVVVGVAQGDRPSWVQGLGVVVAVVGVVLASGPEVGAGGAGGRRSLLLAAVAAVGFGAVIVSVAQGARSSTTMTLLTMRAASVAVMAVVVLTGRLRLPLAPRDQPAMVAVGAGDVGANAMFAVASTKGSLAMVSVLASLYPAVTAVWARAVHGEELRRAQQVGVAAALAGVAMIASGGV